MTRSNRPLIRDGRCSTAQSAEQMFQEIMRNYFQRHGSARSIAARVEEQVAPLALTGRDARFLASMREGMRTHISDHRGLFEHYRRLFFFIDEQPEGSERFDIWFESCWPNVDGALAENV